MNRLGSFPVSPGHINPPVILGPNITGELTVNIPWTSANESGALKGTSYGRNYCTGPDWQNVMGKILLNAQNGNSTYGRSETIQPSSVYALIMIKV